MKKIPLQKISCDVCKNYFESQRSSHRKYCSKDCYIKSMYGRKNPNAIKAMLKKSIGSLAFWNRDPIKIEKQRLKMIGRKRPEHSKIMLGEGNPSWKGGKSFEPYTREWNKILKNKIKTRDNNKCFICGSFNRLQVHHIDYDKANCSDKNLITLCISCHMKTNYRRENWKQYFKNI